MRPLQVCALFCPHFPPDWVPKFSLNMVASHLSAAAEHAARSNQLAAWDLNDPSLLSPPRICPALPVLPSKSADIKISPAPVSVMAQICGEGLSPDGVWEKYLFNLGNVEHTAAYARAHKLPSIFTPVRPRAHKLSTGRAHPPHNASLIFRCSWPGCCWGRVFSIGSCVW